MIFQILSIDSTNLIMLNSSIRCVNTQLADALQPANARPTHPPRPPPPNFSLLRSRCPPNPRVTLLYNIFNLLSWRKHPSSPLAFPTPPHACVPQAENEKKPTDPFANEQLVRGHHFANWVQYSQHALHAGNGGPVPGRLQGVFPVPMTWSQSRERTTACTER
jgi:hypothetical protein